MMADDANEPSSSPGDSNSYVNESSESHDDEDAGTRPGENNPVVAHAPEPEAIVPAMRGHGGRNGVALLGVGHAARQVSGPGAGR